MMSMSTSTSTSTSMSTSMSMRDNSGYPSLRKRWPAIQGQWKKGLRIVPWDKWEHQGAIRSSWKALQGLNERSTYVKPVTCIQMAYCSEDDGHHIPEWCRPRHLFICRIGKFCSNEQLQALAQAEYINMQPPLPPALSFFMSLSSWLQVSLSWAHKIHHLHSCSLVSSNWALLSFGCHNID